ncbi:MAG: NYN domain-containing protein [Candidatus Aminicenantaceae bacterium]
MVETYESKTKKIALLIDGDNAQPRLIQEILAEAGKYGALTIRRIYGDWTTSNMQGWKDTLNSAAIQPIQQFRFTVGKNATDSAMIIDAMDILHSRTVDGFCVVSSDSDYTRLATRIRESGVFVMGIGKRITPKAFVNACNVFIFTENFDIKARTAPKGRKTTKQASSKEDKEAKEDRKIFDPLPLLKGAFDMAIQEDGWANIATMGFYLRQLDPSFDPRTYGHRQLSQLLKSQSKLFDMRFQETPGSTDIFVRLKD